MWAPCVVEVEVTADRSAGLADAVVALQIYLLVLTVRHSRSTKTLSRQAPLPSMLIAMRLLASTPPTTGSSTCSARKQGRLAWRMVLDLTRELDIPLAYEFPREARARMRQIYDEDRWFGEASIRFTHSCLRASDLSSRCGP